MVKRPLREFLPTVALPPVQDTRALLQHAEDTSKACGAQLSELESEVLALIDCDRETLSCLLERTANHAVARALRPVMARLEAAERRSAALTRRDQTATRKLAERDALIAELRGKGRIRVAAQSK